MLLNAVFYRPLWTCGRYHEESHSALLFNLIEGKSYFFEDLSADFVGYLLSYKRNEAISLPDISAKSEISIEVIASFLDILEQKGLVTTYLTDDRIVSEYRLNTYKKRVVSRHVSDSSNDNFRNTTLTVSTAERSYAQRTNSPVSTVLFELTYQCCEKCVHCYNPGAERSKNDKNKRGLRNYLAKKEYFRIIDELYKEGTVRICLSGGDPFSNPFIWDIIDYLYEKEFAIEIYTNGLAIVGNESKLLSYFPCVVGISIYSSIPEVHDSITRVKGSFSKSLSVLETLASNAQILEVKCCIMQQNLKSYLGVKDIARHCNATLQLECAIFDSSDGDHSIRKYLRLTEEQLEVVLRDIDNPLYVGKETYPKYGKILKDLSDMACRACINGIAISPDGTLIPCSSFHAYLGNIGLNSLHEILSNNKFISYWKELTLSKYEECGKYEYCDFCKLCPGLNFAEHGTPLKASENNCFIAKVRNNLAKKLESGHDPLNGRSLSEAIEVLEVKDVTTLKKEMGNNYFNNPLISNNYESGIKN